MPFKDADNRLRFRKLRLPGAMQVLFCVETFPAP